MIERATGAAIRAQFNMELFDSFVNSKIPHYKSTPDDEPKGWEEKRESWEVVPELSTWQDQNLVQLVKKLKPGSKVLDYGCGHYGVTINQMQKAHELLECVGVTYPTKFKGKTSHRATIYYEEGNAFLKRHKEAFDLIYAHQSVRYGPDPFMTLKRLYAALKPNAVLLVSPISLHSMPVVDTQGNKIKAEQLITWWNQQGYVVESNITADRRQDYSLFIAIQKNPLKPHLKVPLSLVTIPELFQLKLDPFYRNLRKFPMLGYLMHTLEYVYLFNPELTPVYALLASESFPIQPGSRLQFS